MNAIDRWLQDRRTVKLIHAHACPACGDFTACRTPDSAEGCERAHGKPRHARCHPAGRKSDRRSAEAAYYGRKSIGDRRRMRHWLAGEYARIYGKPMYALRQAVQS